MRYGRFTSIFSIICFVLLSARDAHAQLSSDPTLERGIKPYGAFEGGSIDSVNMTNGDLNIHIPLFSYPQRGGKLHLGFYLKFSNNSYYHVPRGAANCGATNPPECEYGDAVSGALLAIVPDFSLTASVSGVIPPNNGPYANIKTPDGAMHEVGATSTGWRTIDATGYLCVSNCATVIDRNGIRYSNLSSGGVPLKIEDPNGNFITGTAAVNGSATSYTDTMGRNISLATTPTDTSGCTGTLPTSSAALWTLPSYQGGQMTYKLCYATVYYGANWCVEANRTINCSIVLSHGDRIQSIILPNNTAWTFQWDTANPSDPNSSSASNLRQITFPTGGYIKYSWNAIYICQTPTSTTSTTYTYSVATRTVNSNDGTGDHVWTYTFPNVSNGGINYTPYTASSIDPLGQKTSHTLTPLGGTCSFYETQVKSYDASNNLLHTVSTDYHADGDPMTIGTVATNSSNVVPIRVTTSWLNGQVYKIETDPDSGVAMTGNQSGHTLLYGIPIAKREYDYGSGAFGPLIRTSTTAYQALSSSNYLNNNLLTLPSSVVTKDGSGTIKATTNYFYDQSAPVSSGITIQHETSPNSGYPGNATTVQQWLNLPTSTYLNTSITFFDTGAVQKTIDPGGHSTTFAYSSTFDGAYPTTITNALTQSVTKNYDFNTGLLTSSKDSNDQTTTFGYDSMWRLASVTAPDGGSTIITHQESAFPFTSTLTRTITSSPVLNFIKTYTFDGLGRATRSALSSDPDGITYIDTSYDALGRVSTVTNPYRSTSDSTYGITTYNYDALGRTTIVIPPDGTASANNISTIYSGNTATFTDEAGKARKSVTDGLGHLTQVFEDPAGLNYEADYTYDALNNLLTVNQKGGSTNSALWRTRTFTYDSLSRLVCASNPENSSAACPATATGTYTSGTTGYVYDANGNLTSKISPAPNQTGSSTVTTTYQYDALNRLTQKSYSDGVTLAALFGYDQTTITMGSQQITISNSIGRLSWTCVLFSAPPYCPTMTANSYDPMGRIAGLWQANQVNNNNISVSYTYDLLGDETNRNLSGNNYPSTYTAAARLLTFKSINFNDATNPPNLLTGTHYNALGQLSLATFANGLSESWNYDSRGRLKAAAVGTNCGNGTGTCSGSSVYSFSLGFAPNSNVMTANDSVNGNWAYSYDQLNRLSSASSDQSCKGLSWTYDAWGNRTDQTVTNGTCNTFHAMVGTNNRLGSPYTYDAAGNMTYDGIHHYIYDAENRIISVDSGATAYTYDALGRRVAKSIGGSVTDFIYDREEHVILTTPATPTFIEMYAAGLHFATYVLNSAHTVLYYNHADWLSTERARTDLSGNACEKISSLAFGDGQTITGTCGDISPRHFTGKERDSESGLDNFGARYDSSNMGRFMTPDPLGGRLVNPQTLNKYSYVSNNPVNYVDPTGLYQCKDSAKCDSKQDEEFEKARRKDLKSTDPNVVRAAKAYGDKNTDNGTTVQFGDPGKGKNGTTVSDVRVDPNDPSKVQASETVTIRSGLSGTDLAETVGHEGGHVADAQDFVNTIDIKRGGADQSKNLAEYTTELKAYLVSNSILTSAGEKRNFGDCGLDPCTLGAGVSPARMLENINRLLADPKNYGVTPANPGPVLYPLLTTPK